MESSFYFREKYTSYNEKLAQSVEQQRFTLFFFRTQVTEKQVIFI